MISAGEKYIFVHSPTKMNETGPWLARAYEEILKTEKLRPSELGVVIVHDDLEHSLGIVNTVAWKSNPQGHNGVKSVMDSLPRTTDDAPWVRIAVGIGRPAEAYVISTSSPRERKPLDVMAGKVLQKLKELEQEWRKRVSESGP